MSLKKLAKLGSAVIKTSGQRATERATKVTQGKIRERQAEVRALRGGQVSGLSGRAASSMASDPSAFGGKPRKPGKPGSVR